jgi:drug/metabolite transporter (DMT)-like permease
LLDYASIFMRMFLVSASIRAILPYGALILNALVWGLSWLPLKELHVFGIHALWASAATYILGLILLCFWRPRVCSEFLGRPGLWVLAFAAGCTMVGFNWGVTLSDVIRVVLLFYLMPIWALLFARFILKEAITKWALVRVSLALCGAVLVLSPEGLRGVPWPSNLGECLGLFGGVAFAFNNVMLRHQQGASALARLFAMCVGGACVPLLVAFCLLLGGGSGLIAWPASVSWVGVVLLLGFSLSLLCANYALQFGAARLPANMTAVVMLSEVVFASLSAVLWNHEVLTVQVALGGGLILMAAALSALKH